jgi:hypothetical protein
MGKKLFVTFEFDIPTDTYKVVNTNMNKGGIRILLETYLRDIIGRGADERPPERRDVYTITMTIDVTCDDIRVAHNCGNLGLVAGILMTIYKEYPDA